MSSRKNFLLSYDLCSSAYTFAIDSEGIPEDYSDFCYNMESNPYNGKQSNYYSLESYPISTKPFKLQEHVLLDHFNHEAKHINLQYQENTSLAPKRLTQEGKVLLYVRSRLKAHLWSADL